MTELRDLAAERALLSSLLLHPAGLQTVLLEERLQPDHFASDQHAVIFEALVRVVEQDGRPNPYLLTAELAKAGVPDPKQMVAELATPDVDVVGAGSLARRVRDLHRRRELKLASRLLAEAADLGDRERLAEAEQILSTPTDSERTTFTGRELAERFADRLDESAPEVFHWPFSALDRWTGGGLRRKQVVLIGGWTSAGKSIVYDQILERLADQGLRCHSYINEMSEQERMDRTVARLSAVSFGRIHSRQLSPREDVQVRRSLTDVKVGITECAGWTAHEIARHIRWNRWDVAGVDIIHEIAHREERDLAEIAQVLRATAKSVGCALIACVHLNDQRVTTAQRPRPVLRDVRGSGMLVRGADIVLFIHRDDDEDGTPTDQGMLLAAKIRNGQPSAMGVTFLPQEMKFLPTANETGAVA